MQNEGKFLGVAKDQDSSVGRVVLSKGPDGCEANKSKDNNPTRKYTSVQWITLAILAFTNFCSGACIILLPPLFPREAESKGITATEYGLVFGAYDAAVFVSALITGKLVAHLQPKYILNVGVLVVGVSYVLLGTLDSVPSGSPFLTLAFVIRILEGFGSAAIRTAAFSILAAQFKESTSTNFGLLETCRGLGYIVGPTAGGALFDFGGYALPFYVMGGMELFDAVVVFFLLPKSEESGKKKVNFFKFWLRPGIIIYFLVVFTTLNFSGFNNVTLEPHIRRFNLSGVALGLVFAFAGSMFAVSTGLWGWLISKKVGNGKLILLACFLMIAAQTVIGPLPFFKMEPMLGLIILAQIFGGLAVGGKIVCSFIGALEDTISQGFPRNLNTYGFVSSAFVTAESIGAFSGPSLGGFLVDNLGYRMSTVVMMSLEILLVFILCIYMCTKRTPGPTTEDEEKKPIVANSYQQTPSYC